MNSFPIYSHFLLLIATSLLHADEKPLLYELTFPNRDVLLGLPVGISEKGYFLWRSPFLTTDEVEVDTRQVDSMKLSSELPQITSKSFAIVTFQSHIDQSVDTLQGELLSLDEESIGLRTSYAGDLLLKRSMLQMIEVDSVSAALIRGPGVIDDWTIIENPAAWTIESSNLISTSRGSIAREFKSLPAQIHLEFDLEFEYSPYIRLHFFADAAERLIPSTGYSVSIQRGTTQFLKRVKDRNFPLENRFQGAPHNLQEKNESHIELFIDRQKGSFTLNIDGQTVAAASDEQPLLESNWWHFSTLRSRKQTIRNFAIRAWDGILPEKPELLDFREKLDSQSEKVELRNGDTVLGKASGIAEGKLKIETEFLPVEVPTERIRSFQVTPHEQREEPRIYKEDIRAFFRNGGHISIRVSDITPTTVTGFSQVFGEATFQLSAFSIIHFNPYEPEFRQRRGFTF